MWLSLSYQLNQGPYNVSVSEGSLFKLGEMPPQPYFKGRASCYSDRLCDISFKCVSMSTYRDIYVNSFFPHTARLRNSLPTKCSLTYDLKSLTSQVNWQLSSIFFFKYSQVSQAWNVKYIFSNPHILCSSEYKYE